MNQGHSIAIRISLAAAVAAVLGASVGSARATEGELEDVVVIGAKRKFAPTDSNAATKIEMDVIETPQSMSVLSSELMSIIGVNSINSAAALAPSVVNKEAAIPIFIDTVARGFVVDFWNGNKINGMPFLNGGAVVDFGLVERFEVVRGPASIIYGQSDYGATLNIELKGPKAKRALEGEIGTNSDGSLRTMIDYTGALTADNRLRARLVAVHDDTQTLQDLAYSRTNSFAPSLSWDIGDSTTLDVNYFRGERKMRRGFGFPLIIDPDTGVASLPNVSKRAFIGAAYGVSAATMDFGIAKLTHRMNDHWTVTATGAYHHTSLSWHEPFTWDAATPTSGQLELHDYWSDQESYDYSGDLTAIGKFSAFGQQHTVMLSAFQRKNKVNYFSACCDSVGLIDIYDPQPRSFTPFFTDLPSDPEHVQSPDISYTEQDLRTDRAVSALLLMHPADRWSVMLGLRYNDYRSTTTDYWDRSVSLQTPDQYRNHAVTHRVGVVYEVRPAVNVYASLSNGVIFHPSIDSSGGVLAPETGTQYEVGAKAGLLDRKLTVSAAAFVIDRKNIATHDPNTPPESPYSVAIGGQKHKGLELEAIGEPIPGWNLVASYSYLDVAIREAEDPAMIGQQLFDAPHHLAKFYSTYQIMSGPLKGLSFGGGLFYVGERQVDNFGTFALPAYTRVDLRLGYDALEHVSFSLNAINVTDAKILTSTGGSATEGIAYQDLRTVMFRVGFKY